MRLLVGFLCALSLLPGAASRQIASYTISARLDAQAKAVEGSQTLTWINDSPDTVRELQFHLYMNAFKDERSTFMRERGGAPERLKKGWGWIDVTRIAVAGGPDLTGAMRFIQPDDGNADDRTVMAVDLPQPVKPGASIRLEIDFYTRLPHVVARTGYHGDFYFVAQWFPKIGVWEKAGMRYAKQGRWNCHQFHSNSEFYANFGRYEVEIAVPSGYVIGATGVMESRREDPSAGATTYRFVQDDVHDFAWTASPRFRRIERTFDPARDVSADELAATAAMLGIPESEVRLDTVRMILLIQPEHAAQTERHFRALVNGIKYFGLWYGRYPYETITLVDPPYGGGAAGGMEYPTLITAGTHWLNGEGTQEPEGVIVHEYGHQYWYGVVANNEFEEAWLDEGINTYATSKVLDLAYGPFAFPVRVLGAPVGPLLGFRTTWDAASRGAYLSAPKMDSLLRNSWEYYDGRSYGMNSYPRSAIALRTLENLLGEQTMARVMRAYYQRWRFRHPATPDFIAVVNEVSGKDMQWFFDEFVYGSNVVDYKVGRVRSEQAADKKSYESVIKIQREGEAVVPVEIRFRFRDGEIIDEEWDGRYRWVQYKFTRPAAIESVEIDPGRKILLDVNFVNNSYRDEGPQKLVLKWSAGLLFWVQALLMLAAELA